MENQILQQSFFVLICFCSDIQDNSPAKLGNIIKAQSFSDASISDGVENKAKYVQASSPNKKQKDGQQYGKQQNQRIKSSAQNALALEQDPNIKNSGTPLSSNYTSNMQKSIHSDNQPSSLQKQPDQNVFIQEEESPLHLLTSSPAGQVPLQFPASQQHQQSQVSQTGASNKSASALNTGIANNLINNPVKDQAMNGSQMMVLRGSVIVGGTNTLNEIMNNHNSNSNRMNPQSNSNQQNMSAGVSSSQLHTQQFFKNSKVQMYEKMIIQQQSFDKKTLFSSTQGISQQPMQALQGNSGLGNQQTGLLPRISNLRNEVTVLFKNSNGSSSQQPYQMGQNNNNNINGNQKIPMGVNSMSRSNAKPMSSPRNSNMQPSGLFSETNYFGHGNKLLLDKMMLTQNAKASLELGYKKGDGTLITKEEYAKSLIESKNRNRLKSNHNNNLEDELEDSFQNDQNYFKMQGAKVLYNSEKPGGNIREMINDYDGRQGQFTRDDMSIGSNNKNILNNEEQYQVAMTPQIMSSQSNKRNAQANQQATLAKKQEQQQQQLQQQQQQLLQYQQPAQQMASKPQFFSKRTGSHKDSVGPFKYIHPSSYMTQGNEIHYSFDQQQQQQQQYIQQQNYQNLSPMNSQIQKQILDAENSPLIRSDIEKGAKLQQHHSGNYQAANKETTSPDRDSASEKAKAQNQGGEAGQPKIPVICGFHKRVLLLTSSVGVSSNSQPPGAGMVQTRRIRNKNPNCNHNNNFTFYQPSYNNVKYDDSYKKKEEVLRKVFFKECAKEEEKRTNNNPPNNQTSTKGSQSQAKATSDPASHLKLIEQSLCQTLFLEYEASRNPAITLSMVGRPSTSLMTELGLENAFVSHKAFLLALIQAGKIINENMFKVLHEFKQSARDFDNECIYCKYSLYALRESAKVGAKMPEEHQQQITLISASINDTQQILDNRIENLVRMFQSQLFKRSFINTSLMIIQRKMNEKLLIKQKTTSNIGEKNNEKKKSTAGLAAKEPLTNKKSTTSANNQASTPSQPVSSLDQLSNQMSKLAKNLQNPKDKEKYLELKEKYYREFLVKINQSNGVNLVFPKASFAPYKYYIGKGNNSLLVRNALKTRFWWSMGDFEEWHEYNFIWTQWKSNKILSQIKSNQDIQQQQQDGNPRSGLTSGGTGVGTSDSLMSTQLTSTDRESNSSAETLLATPTRRKRASTLPQNANQITQNNLGIGKKGGNSNSISSSASKNPNSKIQQEPQAAEKPLTSHSVITYSHMENNFHLSNKKAIYYNMKIYYESTGQDWWRVLPLTFHIKEGPNDKEFLKFVEIFKGNDQGQFGNLDKLGKSIWIIKPGENTNRGCGIQVCRDLQSIKDIVQNTHVNGQKRSYIIQKYIEKPLLYKNRKFDIRCYTLLTTVNGNLQGYWYNEGYLRTSSKDFNLKNVTNRLIHLTNDAVQKKSDDYGKFESGNKLSYADFQKYLDSVDVKCNFVKEIVPQLKKMAQDTIKAVSRKIDPQRRHNTFEIFGYDFMIDEDLKPWLIEVNTNPCLELSAPYLARLIPTMIENAMKIAVDPLFPPPPWPNSKKHMIPDCTDNKFEVVFNEVTDAQELKNLPIDDTMNGIIEEEEMEEEGSDGDEEDLN